MLCLVEACRQIGLALGKKGLTVECAASSTDSILRKQGYHIIPKDGCVEYPEWPVTREFIWPKFQR